MKRLLLVFVLLCATLPLAAQTTAVSAVVMDPHSQPYSNGSFRVSFHPNGFPPESYRLNGATFTQLFTGPLDANGAFNVTVGDNSQISPSGSQWDFQVCPNSSSPCTTVTLTITGSSQNVSNLINGALPPIAVTIQPQPNATALAKAYNDTEIQSPVPGAMYFNLTDSCLHAFGGATWGTACGGGGGGIPSVLPNCTATGTVQYEGVQFSTQVVGGQTQVCGQLAPVSTLTAIAVCTVNCGNTGSAQLVYTGLAPALLDNTGVAQDYIIPSATNPGQFTDIGATKPPATVETFGIVTVPNTGGGTTAQVYVQPLSLYAPGSNTNAGNINPAAQFVIPIYSASGSNNILSGSLCTEDLAGNGICNSLTTNGLGTGVITYTEGVPPAFPGSNQGSTYIDSNIQQQSCYQAGGISCGPVYTAVGLKCDGSTNDTTALSAILTAIGSGVGTIQFPPNRKCVIGAVTIPSNVMLDFAPGSALSGLASNTVAIKGGIHNPDNHQIFFNFVSGTTGTIDFTSNTQLTVVYPEWWGAVAGGAASTNTTAIQNAIYGAFGCGPVIACRTNGSGNYIFNRELRFSGQYSVNGTLNVYHMIGFVWSCGNRNGCGLIETASNHTLINGQSVAYGAFKDMTFGTTQAQNAASPLVSLDYNASQGSDIAIQFIDFDHDNFSGAQQGQIGVQIAPSGGTAQGSNISFTNDQFSSFNQACLMIGNGSNGTPSASATNAISIRVAGGDFADCNAYGVANYGGGMLDINGTTFEDGVDSTISGARAQTGYDMFCYIAVSGEGCTAENIRSESLWLVGGFGWILTNVYNVDQIHVLVPSATPAVGALIQGSSAADGVYYQVTGSTSGASGLGTPVSPLTASGGSATTIVDSVGGFSVNAWVGWQVSYVTANSSHQYCVITSNSSTTFTCSAGWQEHYLNKTITNPINGTNYIVEPNWGMQTTSGGITWGALTKTDLGCASCGGVVSAGMSNVFIPGVQIAGPQTSTRVNINSTRADAFSLGGQGYLTYGINDEPTTVVAGLASGGPGGGGGQIDANYIRKPVFYQTGSTGVPGAGAAIGSTNGQAYVVGPQRQDCWIGSPTSGANSVGSDICTGVSVSTPNTGTWYVDNSSASPTPKRLSFDPNGNLAVPGNLISGSGVSATTHYIISSPTCPSPNSGNCYFANWDAHTIPDATTTNGGSTVTCPNNDCNFTSTDAYGRPIAKVGQIVFVTDDTLHGNTDCPQTTIASINNAQSITLTAANDCTENVTANAKLYWGDDDTTNLNAAWTATKCGALQLPGPPAGDTSPPGGYAMAMFQSAIFITSPSCISATSTFQGTALYGAGVTSTYLLATPNFNFTTCTGGFGTPGANIACTGGVINMHYHDFTIWGGGASPSGTSWHGKALFELAPASRAESVDVQGWGAIVPGGSFPQANALYGVYHNSQNGWFSEGGAVFAGNVGCISATLQTIWIGNACEVTSIGANESHAVEILSGASTISQGNGILNNAGEGCNVEVLGTFSSFNDVVLPPQNGISGICIETGATVYTYGNTTVDISAQASTTALYFRGSSGKAYLTGTLLKGGSSGQDIFMTNAASQVYDLGGNTFAGTTHVGNSGTGQIIGATSRTGTAVTAGALVLSANFGTGAAVSVPLGYNSPIKFTITNGSAAVGASPTITYTFPTPYLQAPLFCTATQVGGTNATGTFTAGTPTATSVVFTYSLTPTINDTELMQAVCYAQQ